MEIKIKSLSKSYGKTEALKSVSCTFSEGIYGLLGPNGAGKSTLMNIIVNNLEQDVGQVLLDGEDIRSIGARYRELLGFMPQQQALFERFTARHFLGYMGALKGMGSAFLKARIEEVLSMVNLTKEADKRLGGFSGGMKQRILIAQAILNDPKILILDEPTAGLDPRERIRIRNLISEISFNKVVLIATHVVQDIEFISKEILIMKEGCLVAKESPIKILKNIEGKVYELRIKEEELPLIRSGLKICSMRKEGRFIVARVLSERRITEFDCRIVDPVLEDLYLSLFDDNHKES